MATVNFTIDETTDVPTLLRQWEEDHHAPSYDPIPLLTRLAELIELETDNYNKMDPDPFDERHPSRADPNCALGVMLKVLFRKDSFMNKLVNDYLRENYYSRLGISRDVTKLNIIACRLMIDILPGLETSAVFESPTNDALVQRLFGWAEKSSEPMQTYATGLLAAAMEVQDIAAGFREQNARLVPLMLERLHLIHKEAIKDRHCSNSRPFAHLNSLENGLCESTPKKKPYHHGLRKSPVRSSLSPPPPLDDCAREVAETQMKNGPRKPPEPELRRKSVEAWEPRSPHRPGLMSPPLPRPSPFHVSDCSNSSWAELEPFVIGNVQMFPPTWATRQYFILKYLTPMGEYQEFLSHVFEKNALELILQIMNLRESKNSRLSFEALKYLASLLCHKKFSIEFINMQGLQRLLEVPRPSIAATGVSICLYYLAYCEDAMERVCLLPHHILSDLVSYALWLLECSHDSGRCHATMFFGLSFQFRIILEEFDAQDGLRKLYNVMSTLPILAVEDDAALNEDEECSARQIVRHVCVALKRYLEAHLHIKAEQLRRTHMRDNTNVKMPAALPSYKAMKSSSEEVQEQITSVLELMSFRAQWQPVDELMRLGGITLLLQVIAFAYEWNYSGRAETVRSALEVLCMCAVMPRVQLQLCERVDLPDEAMTVGVNVILGAAEGEIVQDPDVQRAALAVLICCVCAPIHRVGGMVAKFSSTGSAKKRTQNVRSSEEVIEKLWDCVRSNNGIMVLLTLMMVKTPITDADSIRGLACYALVGLARSETVRQIISKLSLFTNGQLQNLMRDPILQDKRQEHVIFQKYALELLERVSGKSKPSGNELEVSLQNIHRANVIAQTHINFNERQLFQLIQQHLVSHGMVESAAVLQQEANLPVLKPPTSSPMPAPFSYKQLSNSHSTTPVRGRSSLLSPHPLPLQRVMVASIQTSDLASPSTSPLGAGYSVRGQSTPLKLSLSRKPETKLIPTSSRSLQKQISYDGMPVMPAALAQSTMPLLKECHVTLDSIITEYLTNQHALCKNPMVTCPQFNLFVPHKCPDPKTRNAIPTNFCMRLMKGSVSRKLNNRLVHSRFCPVKTFRLGDDDAFFTCCEFGRDRQLIVGTHHGEIKMFNLLSGVEEATFQCHDSYISGLQANQDGTLLLSSATWRRPLSVLWGVTNLIEQKFAMDEEDYVEFSKLTQDRVIGTKNEHATIYDAATGKKVLTLTPSLSNQYSKNRATFNPTDELVLSDGVLWDVSSAKQIHKFDKLNQTLSGVFHPNGLEVISNTEVWDLRTFHLLRTVPSLDKCEVQFNRFGSIIYAISMEQEMEEDSSYESSYKTLDATDYANIATMDVKKNIYDLAMNRVDTQIAIVENQGTYDSVQESIVRLYDVGRRRDDEDEVEDEDEEEELDGSDDGSEIDNSDDEIVDVTEENSQNLQNLLDEIARDVDELNDELQENPDAPDAEERNDDDSASSLDLMDDSSTDDMEVNIDGSDSSGES